MERNKKVQMSMSALAEMIKKHYGLPPDAVYQGSEYDAKKDAVTVTFKHQTFDMVKEPEVIGPVETKPEPVSVETDNPKEKPQPEKKKNG